MAYSPPEETALNCVICKHGEVCAETATVTLARDALTLVVRSVPARVCDNCGEEYVDDKTAAVLLQQAEAFSREGVVVAIRDYAAA